MKKYISLLLSFTMVIVLLTGCGGKDSASNSDPVATIDNNSAKDDDSQVVSDSEPDEPVDISTSSPATSAPVEEVKFEFQPKVCSSFIKDIMGKDMCDAWFSLVDAVMRGDNTFECKDDHTYMWMMNEFPDMCFPVLKDLIEPSDDVGEYVKKGKAKFKYSVSRKKAQKKIKKFIKLVEDILNETLKPDYSDFEKALALYIYFSKTYTYDFDTSDLVYNEPSKTGYVCSYRLLTKKIGICEEVAVAYSYLLMQVGIDASVVSNNQHAWSIIKLGNKYYHVDPTYALDNPDIPLEFFLMTDKQRCNTGDFIKKDFEYVSQYIPDKMPDYSSKGKSFSRLWKGYYISFDHDKKVLKYFTYDENFQKKELEFDYSKYP